MNLNEDIIKNFGNKLRIRVSGIEIKNDQILLVNHRQLGTENGRDGWWAPPGGGLQYKESLHECLKREFFEETGLEIEVNEFLFINEFIQPPLHAIELFFKVTATNGSLKKGLDPELPVDRQIICEVEYLSIDRIKKLGGGAVHGIFQTISQLQDLIDLKCTFISSIK